MVRKSQSLARFLEGKTSPPKNGPNGSAYDSQVEWFLLSSASACGERGFCISGSGVRSFDPEKISDQQLGQIRLNDGHGTVTRARLLRHAWQLLNPLQRDELLARYCFAVGDLSLWPGLHGAMGEMSGLCLLLAYRRDGSLERFTAQFREAAGANAERKRIFWDSWRKRCGRVNSGSHAAWLLSLADAEAA